MPNSHPCNDRHSIRLPEYDYSQVGGYYITIVTQGRACLFGRVIDDVVYLNDAGRLVVQLWRELAARFPGIVLDEYVLMPNHLHGIVVIVDTGGNGSVATGRASLGQIIGGFKSISTVEYGRGVRVHEWQPVEKRVWQRNYYEHVIRDERELVRLRLYMRQNPLRWALDDANPDVLRQ